MKPANRKAPPRRVTRYALWRQYEAIAMHFNELLMRLRTQSLAGIAALAAIAGIVVRAELPQPVRWLFLAAAFGLLALFWIAIWILDFGYYNRLLVGAVRGLRGLEDAGRADPNDEMTGITLSTEIEGAVQGKAALGAPAGASADDLGGGWARISFYTVVLAGLILGIIVSLYLAHDSTPPALGAPHTG